MSTIYYNKNIVNRNKGLKAAAAIFFLISIGLLNLDLTKPKFASKADLTFIDGPIYKYNVYNSGKTHSFTFTLNNYSNIFKINTDYLHLLKFDQFSKIKSGTTVRVGFPTSSIENLNSGDQVIFVYSISDNLNNYLDWAQTVKQYNSISVKLFSLTLFFCAVLSFIYAEKIDKN